jgi:hypothetical protein
LALQHEIGLGEVMNYEEKNDLKIELKIEFWPSLNEIKNSGLEDKYLAGLTEYYDSLGKIRNNSIKEGLGFNEFEYIGVSRGRSAVGFMPPEIAEIIYYLGSSGMAVALYKLLRLWVESINGRKIRVRMGDFEIEATQMSEKKFLKLMDILHKREKQKLEKPSDEMDDVIKYIKMENKELWHSLLSNGFDLIATNSEKLTQEKEDVRVEVQKSMKKARE